MLAGNPLSLIEELLVFKLLSPEALRQYSEGAIGHKELTPFVDSLRKLSEEYVRTDRALSNLHMIDARAYALYYLPVNAAKIRHLLEQIALPEKPLNVLDFGCGPGTASLALMTTRSTPLTLSFIEQSESMRYLAEQLTAAAGRRWNCSVTIASPSESSRYDLIIAVNVLNELSYPERFATMKKLTMQLEPEGTIIVLEPALKNSTQDLMRLRDELLEEIPFSVLYPCTHENPCPMRKDPEQWCHGTLRWEAPLLVRQLDKLTGFNKHRTKFSALILSLKSRVSRSELLRVITDTEKSKRGDEAIICGEKFYGNFCLPKKERSDENRAFSRARSYDLITTKGLPSL